MHLRTVTSRSGPKTYTYHQLVQSVRNAKGVPTHKILASFRELPPLLVANLREALAANRQGQGVVVGDTLAQLSAVRVTASRPFLDIVVLWSVAERLGLWKFLASVGLGDEPGTLESVAALVLHRAVAPGSKLAATRWYGTTVLPQWLGLSVEQFNNSRVHRVLSRLEEVGDAIQARLAPCVERESGSIVVLFNDITQLTFEGRGPALASDRRCRDGALRRVIGVALLTDGLGRPLRWRTLTGAYGDGNELVRLAQDVAREPWVAGRPLVMDRAVGQAKSVQMLLEAGVRFVTAVPSTEVVSYDVVVTAGALASLELGFTPQSRAADLDAVRRTAAAAGLTRVTDTRWVLDLGLIERPSTQLEDADGEVAQTLRLGLDLHSRGRGGTSPGEGGLTPGEGPRSLRRYRSLAQIAAPLQARILAGEAEKLARQDLYALARQSETDQPAFFEDLLAKRAPQRRRLGRRPHILGERAPRRRLQVRGVLYFNPERFLDARISAGVQDAELREFVAGLNATLAARRSRRSPAATVAAVYAKLKRRALTDLYDVHFDAPEDASSSQPTVRLERREEAWGRRRRLDGYSLVISHPDVLRTPSDLVELYFSKDQVEKNFQTIKSELEIQPVHHRTDPKVRAHVDLCMLALLVERWLENHLRGAGLPMSARACLETLATCHLSLLRAPWGDSFAVTDPTDDQTALLRALKMEHLLDRDTLGARLAPA